MLEAIDLDRRLKKSEYRQRFPALQSRLHRLQRAYADAGVSSLIVFEGWDGAGKGRTINKLTEKLEPRAFHLHPIREPRSTEAEMPRLWRFWQRVPAYGEMAIFDCSWYTWLFQERAQGRLTDGAWTRSTHDVVRFERALADDRVVLTKFFFHIRRKEQARRLKAWAKDPAEGWRVGAAQRQQQELYDPLLVAVEETLQGTDTEWAPWTLVEATDLRWARVKVVETLIQRLEFGLERWSLEVPAAESPAEEPPAEEPPAEEPLMRDGAGEATEPSQGEEQDDAS
jgi:polyphosphate kinase 2 (PPK2 family)